MEKIPTAEAFLNQKPFIHGMTRGDQQIAMIEFAKLHVENFTKSNLNLEEYLKLHVK